MYVTIHLHNLPEAELDPDGLTGEELLDYAGYLNERVCHVAAIVDKLLSDGWQIKVVKCDIVACHPQVRTCKEAGRRLGELDIGGDDVAEWNEDGKWPTSP